MASVPSDQTTPVLPSKAQLKPVPKDIDVGELTDILLGEQKEWIGGTVKCDDESSDPYAFASVLDMRAYEVCVSRGLRGSYVIERGATLMISLPSSLANVRPLVKNIGQTLRICAEVILAVISCLELIMPRITRSTRHIEPSIEARGQRRRALA